MYEQLNTFQERQVFESMVCNDYITCSNILARPY